MHVVLAYINSYWKGKFAQPSPAAASDAGEDGKPRLCRWEPLPARAPNSRPEAK